IRWPSPHKGAVRNSSPAAAAHWLHRPFPRVQSLASTMKEHPTDDQAPRKLTIAIDGPAGAGKSTVASRLARKPGYVNLERGEVDPALAPKAVQWDVLVDDEAALFKMAQDSRIALEPTIGGNRVLMDGRDISGRIRERDVTEAASKVSVHPNVRAWMVDRQRELGVGGGVVME